MNILPIFTLSYIAKVVKLGGCYLILTVKNRGNTWVVENYLNEDIAKAKVEEKKSGVYGKIIHRDSVEQEILFNLFACKNGRLKITVFENEKIKTALYRDIKLTNGNLPYFSYRMKYDNYSYYGHHVKTGKNHSSLYLYCQNKVVAVFSIIRHTDCLHIDIFAEDHIDVKMLIAFMICHQIFVKQKRLFTNEYAPKPLNVSDEDFVRKIKEYF